MKKSQPKIDIVASNIDHVRSIAPRMRQSDIDEVWAMSGKRPLEALEYSLEHSTYIWTVLVDGKPEVMFGIREANVLCGVAIPWLLGTDAIDRYHILFLRKSRFFLSQLLARYNVLTNYVDVRNKLAVRWLKWLGFEFSPPIYHNGVAFYRFELRADNV